MLSKYLATLAILLAILSFAASTLSFATRSQVLAGQTLDETFQLDFTLDADSTHTYPVTPALQKSLEGAITFPCTGTAQIVSSRVVLAPKDVKWTENKQDITAPGAGMIANVTWTTASDAANGAHGVIYVNFPAIPGLNATPTFHGNGFQADSAGRYELREVTAYKNSFWLALGRFTFAFTAALPFGIALHSVFWAFVLRKEKRARIAAFPQQGSQLPRTFYPNPILEWTLWTMLFGVFSIVGGIISGISISEGFMSSFMVEFIYGFVVAPALLTLIAVYFTRKNLLTVTVKSDGLSYARGRGELQWQNITWSDVAAFSEKSRTYKGNTRYWLEFEFKDKRKKLKLSQDIHEYPVLRSLIFSILKPAT
jgi:hypothetical protein